PFRQPGQRHHDPRIDRAVERLADRGPVRDRAWVGERYLPATAPPPGHVRVQRGPDHPRRRRRMPADRAPARPRPGDGLGHQVLRGVPVADAPQDGEQALIFGPAVELREVRPVGFHALPTHDGIAAVTWRRGRVSPACIASLVRPARWRESGGPAGLGERPPWNPPVASGPVPPSPGRGLAGLGERPPWNLHAAARPGPASAAAGTDRGRRQRRADPAGGPILLRLRRAPAGGPRPAGGPPPPRGRAPRRRPAP